jgi:hypothetical protein
VLLNPINLTSATVDIKGGECSETMTMTTNRKTPTPEEVLAHLRFNSPYLAEINERLAGGITAIQKTATNLLEGDLLNHLLQLNLACLELSVLDYTALAGTFNHFRTRTDSYDLRDELKSLITNTESTSCRSYLSRLLSIIEGAWKIAEKRLVEHKQATSGFVGKLSGVFKKNAPELAFSQEFASDALLILRTTFPAGVNMLSPNWDGEFDSLDGESSVRLKMVVPDSSGSNRRFHDTIEIAPYGRGVSLISYSSPHNVKHSFPQMIRNGESILVGRDLGIKELFGVSRKSNPILLVEVKGNIEDPNVSRAGLMIFRHKNRIYIFNRGSMNNYVIEEHIGEQELTTTDFSANTVLKDGGFFTFGQASQTILGSAAALRENMNQTTFQPIDVAANSQLTMAPGASLSYATEDSTFISKRAELVDEPSAVVDVSSLVEIQSSLVPEARSLAEDISEKQNAIEPDVKVSRTSSNDSDKHNLPQSTQLTLPPMSKEQATGTTNTGSFKRSDMESSHVVAAGDETGFAFKAETYETPVRAETKESESSDLAVNSRANASTAFNRFSALFGENATDSSDHQSATPNHGTSIPAALGVEQSRASTEYEMLGSVSQTAGTVLSSRSDIPGIGKLEIEVPEEADIIIDEDDA